MNAAQPPATSLSASTAGGAGKGAFTAKILVGVLVIGGLGYGGYLLFGRGGDDKPRATAEMQPVAVVEAAPRVEAAPMPAAPQPVENRKEPETQEEPVEVATKAAPPATVKKRARPNGKKRTLSGADRAAASAPAPEDPLASLREEKKLISKAKEVLDDGNPALAMKVLERHASRFPNGVLAQDRAGLRVLALCDLGKIERARKEAEKFLERWPRAPMAHRVRSACARATP
jgi:hypothetical protein